MKLSDVKTKAEFYAVADCWYQRALSMNAIWQNDKESLNRRTKAGRIWLHYSVIVLRYQMMAYKLQQHSSPEYPPGGMI